MEVVAHELFDGQHPLPAPVLQKLRQPQLLGPAQPVAQFARVKVHLVSHAQQKALRRDQPAIVELRQHAHVVQSVRIGHAALMYHSQRSKWMSRSPPRDRFTFGSNK